MCFSHREHRNFPSEKIPIFSKDTFWCTSKPWSPCDMYRSPWWPKERVQEDVFICKNALELHTVVVEYSRHFLLLEMRTMPLFMQPNMFKNVLGHPPGWSFSGKEAELGSALGKHIFKWGRDIISRYTNKYTILGAIRLRRDMWGVDEGPFF